MHSGVLTRFLTNCCTHQRKDMNAKRKHHGNKSTNSHICHEAWAAKYRPFLKVVDLWVKSLPLVIEYNFSGLPEEVQESFLHRHWIFTKSSNMCAWTGLDYSEHSRQLTIKLFKTGPVCCGSLRVSLQYIRLSVAGMLFWHLPFVMLFFHQYEQPHKGSECHHQSISAS